MATTGTTNRAKIQKSRNSRGLLSKVAGILQNRKTKKKREVFGKMAQIQCQYFVRVSFCLQERKESSLCRYVKDRGSKSYIDTRFNVPREKKSQAVISTLIIFTSIYKSLYLYAPVGMIFQVVWQNKSAQSAYKITLEYGILEFIWIWQYTA